MLFKLKTVLIIYWQRSLLDPLSDTTTGIYCPSCSFQKRTQKVEMYLSCLVPWSGKEHLLYFVNFPVIMKLPPSSRGRGEAVVTVAASMSIASIWSWQALPVLVLLPSGNSNFLSHSQKCGGHDGAMTCPGCNPISCPVATGIGSPL